MSNRLKNETSPYLLQHAENPVEWYPWCDEAFEKAKKENNIMEFINDCCNFCIVQSYKE